MKNTVIFICAMLISATAIAEDFKDTKGKYLDLLKDGKPLLRYMYEYDTSTDKKAHETYKVFYHVMDEAGTNTLTKGANHKFTHHRGIYIGWNKLGCNGKTSDLWHMNNGAVQKHNKILKQESDSKKSVLSTRVDWIAVGGKDTLIEETRTATVYKVDDAHLLLDFVSELKAVGGDLSLNGDPEHAGMQYRPHQDVVENKSAEYTFHKEGLDLKKDFDLPWAAETYELRGKKYSVQHMNHPDNPTGSRYSAYRDYGRFGSFPVAKIKKGETLTLKYRIRITLGEALSVEAMNKKYAEFCAK